MSELKFAIFGAGFWTRYQLSGWRELRGARCVAIYNRTRSKAEALARELNIPAVYDDAELLLREVRPDFVDNITEVGGHKPLSLLCARHRVPCICQKPMAPSLAEARAMVAAFAKTKTPFFVHENWRWQTPIRAVRKILNTGKLGKIFRARIDMISGFEGWKNQPALAELENFILTDLGTHLLDTARFLFDEADSLYCTTKKTLPKILKGENVATVMMEMGGKETTVVCQMAYAKTPVERECFPQTLLFLEGENGSLELTNDYWIRVTTREGTHLRRHAPPRYSWANPAYDIAHASIVDCCANLLQAIQGKGDGETTGSDNLKTLELVYASYESARSGKVIRW